eukprot:2094460-Amphidinium_carterae.1
MKKWGKIQKHEAGVRKCRMFVCTHTDKLPKSLRKERACKGQAPSCGCTASACPSIEGVSRQNPVP